MATQMTVDQLIRQECVRNSGGDVDVARQLYKFMTEPLSAPAKTNRK